MALSERGISYRDHNVELRGLLVANEDGTGRPGLLVVHGGAGLDDHARARSRQLADLGLVVFACDMYGRGVAGNRERTVATLTHLVADRSALVRRVMAGIGVLESHPDVNGRIGAVGYCAGGRAVLELARSGVDLAGVVSVHGSLETSGPARPNEIKTKILVCHGALDPYVPAKQVTAFVDEMNAASADYQLIVYGGAMHGFTHDVGPQMPGIAYDAPAAERSFVAIKTFLAEIFDTNRPNEERNAGDH